MMDSQQTSREGYRAEFARVRVQSDIWIMSPHWAILDKSGSVYCMGSTEADAWEQFHKKQQADLDEIRESE